MDKKTSCSVVIPVFNGAESLPFLIPGLLKSLDALFHNYEVLLVNDGSKDESWRVIEESASRSKFIRGINLLRNYGQHNATLTGILQAGNDLILTMDDDLQHRPEDISLLLFELGKGYDVVYGYPIKKAQHAWRNLGSWLTRTALKKAMGIENASRITSFRLFRREVCNAFSEYDNSTVLVDVLLSWGTNRFGFVPVQHDERKNGVSNYNFARLARFAFDLITGFSDWPLKLSSFIGVIFSLLGVAVLLYVLIRYAIVGESVPGFPFLASIIAIFSGAQLLSLGIIGEYIGRIHSRSIGKPFSAIRQVTRNRNRGKIDQDRAIKIN